MNQLADQAQHDFNYLAAAQVAGRLVARRDSCVVGGRAEPGKRRSSSSFARSLQRRQALEQLIHQREDNGLLLVVVG
jgi:hypothetical protein